MLVLILYGCRKDNNILSPDVDSDKQEIAKTAPSFLENPDFRHKYVLKQTFSYENGKKLALIDSADTQFNIVIAPADSLANNFSSSLSTINVEITEVELGGRNPAIIRYLANVNCESIDGRAFVKSVTDMAITLTNNSTTTYYNNIEDTWYTKLTGVSYSHTPVGFSSVTLYWMGSKIVRHTVKQGSAAPVSDVNTTPINTSRTYNASAPVPE